MVDSLKLVHNTHTHTHTHTLASQPEVMLHCKLYNLGPLLHLKENNSHCNAMHCEATLIQTKAVKEWPTLLDQHNNDNVIL